MHTEDVLNCEENCADEILENSIRPESIDEYIGQKDVKENIKVFVEAAKMRED